MPWFPELCRNLGLTVHNVMHPNGKPTQKTTVSHTVEEQQVSPTTTLRRTTIEEVEIRHPAPEQPAEG